MMHLESPSKAIGIKSLMKLNKNTDKLKECRGDLEKVNFTKSVLENYAGVELSEMSSEIDPSPNDKSVTAKEENVNPNKVSGSQYPPNLTERGTERGLLDSPHLLTHRVNLGTTVTSQHHSQNQPAPNTSPQTQTNLVSPESPDRANPALRHPPQGAQAGLPGLADGDQEEGDWGRAGKANRYVGYVSSLSLESSLMLVTVVFSNVLGMQRTSAVYVGILVGMIVDTLYKIFSLFHVLKTYRTAPLIRKDKIRALIEAVSILKNIAYIIISVAYSFSYFPSPTLRNEDKRMPSRTQMH